LVAYSFAPAAAAACCPEYGFFKWALVAGAPLNGESCADSRVAGTIKKRMAESIAAKKREPRFNFKMNLQQWTLLPKVARIK
jgi:hypothetical protein